MNLPKLVLSLFVSVLLANCATPPPPNVEGCARLQLGAACAYTINGEQRRLSEADWLDIRLGRISFSPEHYAEIRKFIEQTCAIHRDCKVEELIPFINDLEKKLLIDYEFRRRAEDSNRIDAKGQKLEQAG